VSGTRFDRFLRDESGGYTIWSLIWFSLYVAMGGLAVDMTDAYRNQTLLQATADASSLAAVMSLPDQDDGLAQALTYATDNMNPAINGNVLEADEVIFGNWNSSARKFIPGTADPDAVRVITRRDDANSNPLATNFLRILSLWGLPVDRWNISVEAVAVKYVSRCLKDGFTAANEVDMNGHNDFHNDICIHGQNHFEDNGQNEGISIRNDNTFDGPTYDEDAGVWLPGVTVSTPYPDQDITNNSPTCGQNTGLCSPDGGAKTAADSWPDDVDELDKITQGLLEPTSVYMPGNMYQLDANGDPVLNDVGDPMLPVMVTIPNEDYPGPAEKYDGPYDEYTIYNMECSSGKKTVDLPTDTEIKNVVIVADCNISASSGVALKGVALVSTYAGNGPNGLENNSIHMAAGSILGDADYCEEGGGVELYSAASVHIAAGGEWHGLRIVAVHDVKITSNNVGVYGISVQAGHNIDMSSNNEFGLCTGGVPGVFVPRYRLVL
jgi:hypothetical protein